MLAGQLPPPRGKRAGSPARDEWNKFDASCACMASRKAALLLHFARRQASQHNRTYSMRLSARTDIQARPEEVFAELADFERFERMALRAGAEVVRTDTNETPSVGNEWLVKANLRGRKRRIDLSLVDLEAPERLKFHATSQGFDMTAEVVLSEPRPGKTRLQFALDVRPKTLASRIAIQSARLRKSSLEARFRDRIGGLARLIEDRIAERRRKERIADRA